MAWGAKVSASIDPAVSTDMHDTHLEYLAENIPLWETVCTMFMSGWLSSQLHKWKCITNDNTVLSYVRGVNIPFVVVPCQTGKPVCIIGKQYEAQVTKEITLLLQNGSIEPTVYEEGQFTSNFFLIPKGRTGKFRLIFNLKYLNECVRYDHFKMENMPTAMAMMTQDCYMENIDLKDAYHSVAIRVEDRKFLKLEWIGKTLSVLCFTVWFSVCAPGFYKTIKTNVG